MTWEALAGLSNMRFQANALHVSEPGEHNDSFVLRNLPDRRKGHHG
jgi:hypothetical protein